MRGKTGHAGSRHLWQEASSEKVSMTKKIAKFTLNRILGIPQKSDETKTRTLKVITSACQKAAIEFNNAMN
jgi:hypothetical protein